MRVYRKKISYICYVQGEICGSDPDSVPDCKHCDSYMEWKKSGLSLKEWINGVERG